MKTFAVAFTLCITCSLLVSSAAILLKPRQAMNRELDIRKNILIASGLGEAKDLGREDIQEAFHRIEAVIVDLETGDLVEDIDPDDFDMNKAIQDPAARYVIPAVEDTARIGVRARYARVYLVKESGGARQAQAPDETGGDQGSLPAGKRQVPEDLVQIILPVHGKGLWSTLYGFLALDKDTRTVRGLIFYQHGETPGMGGEVDNPKWRAQWQGKVVYDGSWQPKIRLVKGGVSPAGIDAIHQVDALSGATMTSRGVESLLHYWLGENGYGPFLDKVRDRVNGPGGGT
jgi:Na+-transporting NADH:ubiquinone oxidoreductase subunit C